MDANATNRARLTAAEAARLTRDRRERDAAARATQSRREGAIARLARISALVFRRQAAAVREAAYRGDVSIVFTPSAANPSAWLEAGFRVTNLKRDDARERLLVSRLAELREEMAQLSLDSSNEADSIHSILFRANPYGPDSVEEFLEEWWTEERLQYGATGSTIAAIAEVLRSGSKRALMPHTTTLNRIADAFLLSKKVQERLNPVQRTNGLLPSDSCAGDLVEWRCPPNLPKGKADVSAGAMNWIATTGQTVMDRMCRDVESAAAEGYQSIEVLLLSVAGITSVFHAESDRLATAICLETVCDMLTALGYKAEVIRVPAEPIDPGELDDEALDEILEDALRTRLQVSWSAA